MISISKTTSTNFLYYWCEFEMVFADVSAIWATVALICTHDRFCPLRSYLSCSSCLIYQIYIYLWSVILLNSSPLHINGSFSDNRHLQAVHHDYFYFSSLRNEYPRYSYSMFTYYASGLATNISVRIPVPTMQLPVSTEAAPVSVQPSVGTGTCTAGTGIHKDPGNCGYVEVAGIGRYSQVSVQVPGINP